MVAQNRIEYHRSIASHQAACYATRALNTTTVEYRLDGAWQSNTDV
jgi:hypothetical protein